MLSPDGIVGIRVSIGPDPQPGQTPDDFLASFFQSPELVVRDADGDVIETFQLRAGQPNSTTFGSYQNIFGLTPGRYTADVPQEFVVVSDEQTVVEIAINMGACSTRDEH
jgi:hypothetical protein